MTFAIKYIQPRTDGVAKNNTQRTANTSEKETQTQKKSTGKKFDILIIFSSVQIKVRCNCGMGSFDEIRFNSIFCYAHTRFCICSTVSYTCRANGQVHAYLNVNEIYKNEMKRATN